MRMFSWVTLRTGMIPASRGNEKSQSLGGSPDKSHHGRIHGLKSGGQNHGEREERGAEDAKGVWCGEGVSKPRLWLVKPAIASLCVKKVAKLLHDCPPGVKFGGTRPHVPLCIRHWITQCRIEGRVKLPFVTSGIVAMYDKVHGEKMNKYVSTPYCRVAMYTGGVACCPLVSHVEYSPSRVNVRKKTSSAVLMLKNMRQTDGRTDRRTPGRYITLTARRGHRKSGRCDLECGGWRRVCRRTQVCSASSSTRTVACQSTRRTSSESTAVNDVPRCLLIFSRSPTTPTPACLSVSQVAACVRSCSSSLDIAGLSFDAQTSFRCQSLT